MYKSVVLGEIRAYGDRHLEGNFLGLLDKLASSLISLSKFTLVMLNASVSGNSAVNCAFSDME